MKGTSIRPFIFALVLAALSVPAAAQARVSIPARAILAAGPRDFTVEVDRGREAWGRWAAELTAEYLAALEGYIGIPFPFPTSIVISGRNEVFQDNPTADGYGRRVQGINNGDRIEVEYGNGEAGAPALLYHELGHYWFGYLTPNAPSQVRWCQEGIVSFLPIALARDGSLSFSERGERLIFESWGSGAIRQNLRIDLPMLEDLRLGTNEEAWGLYYQKNFYCQFLLFQRLGRQGYRDWIRSLLALGPEFRFADQIIDALDRIQTADWRRRLTGWVFAGSYQDISYADFLDEDGDGLTGVEERLAGYRPDEPDTDGDGIPDGVELRRGLSPIRADSRAAYLAALRADGPWPDGAGREWEDIGHLRYSQSVGTCIDPAFDIRNVLVAMRGGALHVRVETAVLDEGVAMIPAQEGVMFDVLCDANEDGNADFEYAFALDAPASAWRFSYTDATMAIGQGIAGGRGACFEIRIPAALLPSSPFRILPIIRDNAAALNIDEASRWIAVESAAMEALERYALQSNLAMDDADGDGIPDGAELAAGTDPTRPDPSATLARLGPFADGRASDWTALGSTATYAMDTDERAVAPPYDIVGVSHIVRNGIVFVSLRTQVPLVPNPDVMVDILVDRNGDGRSELEFIFASDDPAGAYRYRAATDDFGTPMGYTAAVGELIEFAIPRAALENGSSLRILPIVRNTRTATNYDETAWIEVRGIF